jgi:hypothetical protein
MNQFNSYATKIGSKLELSNKEALIQWIKNLPEGENLVVKFNISKFYKSNRQIRLLYSCFRAIANHTGQSVEDIKLILKLKAGLCFSHTIEGENVTVCKSISDFSKQEISDFIQFINEWSISNLNLTLLTSGDIIFLQDSK